MPKTSVPLPSGVPAAPRERRLRRTFWIGILAAGLAPILWEGAAICHSQWCEVIGYPREAHTPIVDTLHRHLGSTQESIRESIAIHLGDFQWDPKIVLPVGGLLIVLGMMMLKR
jgi:hypothetical protein